MHPILQKYHVRPGDVIVRHKSDFQLIEHYGVFLGTAYQYGDVIIENHYVNGVRIVTVDEFFKDVKTVLRINRFTGDNIARTKAVQQALNKIGLPYNLINYNCEHFANHVQVGLPTSRQVEVGFGVALLSLVAVLIMGKI
jgi:uncharacterized protein YycO